MLNFKRSSRGLLASLIVASLLFNQVAFADDAEPTTVQKIANLIPIPVVNAETVASFIKRLDPLTEFAAGAALIAMKDRVVLGGFAHETGVYLVLASAFDLGDEIVETTSALVPSFSQTAHHFVSASVLYLGGMWTFKNGAPVGASDWAKIFVRASAANQISAGFKSFNANALWTGASELLFQVAGTAFIMGPMQGSTDVQGRDFESQFFKSLLITSAYRAKDAVYQGMTDLLSLSETKAQIYTAEALSIAAYLVMQYAPSTTGVGVISNHLVEASFFGLTMLMNAPFTLAAGFSFWTLLQLAPDNRIFAQAESGIRQGFVIFTLAPMLKPFLPWAYQSALNYWSALSKAKGSDEL